MANRNITLKAELTANGWVVTTSAQGDASEGVSQRFVAVNDGHANQIITAFVTENLTTSDPFAEIAAPDPTVDPFV